MFDDYGSRFSKPARERPERFRHDCLALLEKFCLVRTSNEGLEVSAFASRFRAKANLVDGNQPASTNSSTPTPVSALASQEVMF